MGADQSTLSAAAEEAGRRADEEIQKYADIERQKLSLGSRKKAQVAQTLPRKGSTAVDNLEPGEILSQSDGDQRNVPIRPGGSSQSVSGPSDLLKSFEPRKQKVMKKRKVKDERTSEDEFVGFGNESALGESDEPMKPTPSKLDATTANLKDGQKTSKVTSSKAHTSARSHSTSSAPMITSPVSAKSPTQPSATIPAKRPSPGDHLNGKGKASLSALQGLGKIPKKGSVASPQSPDRKEDSEAERLPPKWYRDTPYPKSRENIDSGVDTRLIRLRDQMSKAKKLVNTYDSVELQQVFPGVRGSLHILAFQQVNEKVLKKNRVLHNGDGLPQLFDPRYNAGVEWPFDIRADGQELYTKIARKIFDTDIMRGIKFQITSKGTKKEGGDSIDDSYKHLVISAKFHGPGKLINGQWWPFQICALRDGAHGSIQGGIFGAVGEGAYSCIMSGGNDSTGKPYPDEDHGDTVLYCGTDSENGEVTAYTQRMLESVNGEPVRLIRSHNLHSQWAPEVGFRYDGLYEVRSFEKLDPDKSLRQRHRFTLVRQEGQDPIRGNGPEKRPTSEEIKEYHKHQRLSGKTSKGQN